MNEQEHLESNKGEDVRFLPAKGTEIENAARNTAPSILLHKAACMLFGMGTWLPIHFVLSQLPYLIQTAPESWSLPSYMVVTIQLGNIIPFFYYFNKKRLIPYESKLIFITFTVGITCLIALAFTFDIIVCINGNPHSLFLFIFICLLASGCCISILLFLPYMSHFPKDYLVPFFIGQGVDASIPGLLALIQGLSNEEKCHDPSTTIFGSKFFFLLGAFFVALSTMSFFYLNKQVTKFSKEELKSGKESKGAPSRSYFALLLVLQALLSFFQYGFLSGLQSYSCLPYSHGELVYQVTVNVNQFLGGIATYLISFTKLRSTKRLLVISTLLMGIISYEITTAFMSPPPMVGSLVGSVHIAIIWITGNILTYYIKLSIAATLREISPKHLYYYGAATQVGAASGAICSFLMINYTSLLTSAQTNSCKPRQYQHDICKALEKPGQ